MDKRLLAAAAGACFLCLLGAYLAIGGAGAPAEASVVAAPPLAPPASATPVASETKEARAAARAAAIVAMASRPPGGGVDWGTLDAKIDEVQPKDWMSFTMKGWQSVRDDLLADLTAVRALPAEERAAHRESELALLAQLGRAAENANDPIAPCYDQVGGKTVNRPWYEAAALVVAHGDELLDGLGDNERDSVAHFVTEIREGKLPPDVAEPL